MPKQVDHVPYAPLPPDHNHQNVIVLPVYFRRRNHRCLRYCIYAAAAIVLLSLALFFLYPADPDLQLARLRLNNVSLKSSPSLTLDLSFSVTIKVRNRNFFSLDYDKLTVGIGYRGRELGFVRSDGGNVRARGSSYVNATLTLNGLQVAHDVIYLIEDYAKGIIPFDASTKVNGDLGLLFFKIPIEAKVSCEVYVNTDNQTVSRQDCYPEGVPMLFIRRVESIDTILQRTDMKLS